MQRLWLVAVFGLVLVCATAEKLRVDLYAEAFCGYCSNLLVHSIWPLYLSGIANAMDLHLHYAGNTRIENGKIVCQHGESECYLNRVINCGIAKSQQINQWMLFAVCIESRAGAAAYNPKVVQYCASRVSLSGDDVLACANGEEGENLHRAEVEKTQALEPRKRYVPWMVVNEVPMFEMAEYLDKLLCIQLPKADRPKQCYLEGVQSPFRNADFGVCPDKQFPAA